jgi:hypothetical protein
VKSSGAVQEPALDSLDDHAAYVGCCYDLDEVSVKSKHELMAPLRSGLATIQMGNSLNFVAVAAEIRRGAASSFAYANGQPVVGKFDHKSSKVVRESCTG